MQSAMDNGIDEIVAECGGACSCATCHCYVEEGWLDKVTAALPMETEMLECVLDLSSNSRFICQIIVDYSLDGLVIKTPRYHHQWRYAVLATGRPQRRSRRR
mgnify:FL=1